MTFRDARKLHNGDEVTIKETGEVVDVIYAFADYDGDKRKVFVEVYSYNHGFITLSHLEIR